MNNDEIKTYVNYEAFNPGVPEGYNGAFKLQFADRTEIIFDFTQECDSQAEMSVMHDGTLLFVYECFERCLDKMLQDEADSYVIGKITRTEEFDKDGTKFAPKEKPWCKDRTTFIIDYKKVDNHTKR